MTIMRSRLSAIAAMSGLASAAHTATFLDWTPTFTSPAWLYSNTSPAGTISGISYHSGFASAPGTWGMPTAMTTQPPLTCGFQVHGLNGLGNNVEFTFSNGFNWGTGGEMLIGNIHNYYEYMLEAWDFSGNPINVNSFNWLNEYSSSAPGTIGYFSTSSTQRSASGLASKFWVSDPLADANFGQGGIVHLDGLMNIGKLRLTLTDSALQPNAQQVDLMFFNVAAPVPEPSMMAALALGALGLRRRRSR